MRTKEISIGMITPFSLDEFTNCKEMYDNKNSVYGMINIKRLLLSFEFKYSRLDKNEA